MLSLWNINLSKIPLISVRCNKAFGYNAKPSKATIGSALILEDGNTQRSHLPAPHEAEEFWGYEQAEYSPYRLQSLEMPEEREGWRNRQS